MPDMDLQIGIENEMFFKSHGPPLPQNANNIKKFADALVNIYNVARGKELLQSDFSHKSKAGHYDTHNSTGKWTVTTDDAIGAFSLNNSQDVDINNILEVEGRTYSSLLCGVVVTTSLTSMQTPLNLSLRYSSFAMTANGGKK